MRILLQRVSSATVRVGSQNEEPGHIAGQIRTGFLLLVGLTHTDCESELQWMVNKITGLRLFSDTEGKMNLALADVGGSVLVVSQFTLYGDASKGRRPSFIDAAPPELAETLYNRLIVLLRERGLPVESGTFGAHMNVELVNDGPVTIWLEHTARAGAS